MQVFMWMTALGSASAATFLRVDMSINSTTIHGEASFGTGKCQCVGFDNVEGTTDIAGTSYPGDFGARCDAWDKDLTPKCKGPNPEPWCKQKWCYVDPCKCDLPDIPKVSAMLPDAKYQGKPLYYSYETCGSEDSFTKEHHKKACVNQEDESGCSANEKCAWSAEHSKCGGKDVMEYCNKPLPVVLHGHRQCKCIGIEGQSGTMVGQAGSQKVSYPADLGATCESWDLEKHPECKGDNKADWCHDRWCFVDPCDCEDDHVAKQSDHFPGSTFQGKEMFYSYLTCGSEDRYSEKHHSRAQKKQAEVCSSAWTVTPVLAVLLSLVRM